MRVLIHGIDFFPEEVGTGKYTGEMAEWLATRGHEVRVVTTAPHFPQWRTFEGYCSWRYARETLISDSRSSGSLTVTRCPVWIPRDPRGLKRILYLATFAMSCVPVMLQQVFWRPHIVLMIEPTMFCAPHVLFVAWASDSVSWLHVQDFEIDAAFRLGGLSSWLEQIAHRAERFVIRRFDQVSTISDRMIERLWDKGVDRRRSRLVPNWVDTSAIYPMNKRTTTLRQELGLPEQAIVALYSGSMGTKQGLGLLANASRRLASRPDIHFVFCGEGPYREALLASKGDNVTILPLQPTDRFNELLNLADIHLLPQLVDAADLVMPSKLTGMMASGRPVVATTGLGTEIAKVLDGRGIVTKPGDVDDFISAITKLAADSNLRNVMGRAARQHAVEHMDRRSILERFEISIREICLRSKSFIGAIVPADKERLPLS